MMVLLSSPVCEWMFVLHEEYNTGM
jgi:hypothetical protein